MSQSIAELHSRIARLETLLSRARHDVRSGLSPALLAADMLRDNPDPRVQRAGITVLRAIEHVLAMLDATRDPVPARPEQQQPPPS